MQVEIDQSNRVEETERDTILALANNIEYAISIPASVKRQLLRLLRQEKRSDKIIYLQIFSAGLLLLIEPHLNDLTSITIDLEYKGREADIKAMLIRMFQKKYKKGFNFELTFRQIGKKSYAHQVAYNVGRNRKANKIVKMKEILSLL